MSREKLGIDTIDLAQAMSGSRAGVPDKDRVEEDLRAIGQNYRLLGVTGASLRQVVDGLSADFYGGDRGGQVETSHRIAVVAKGVGDAASLIEPR